MKRLPFRLTSVSIIVLAVLALLLGPQFVETIFSAAEQFQKLHAEIP